MMTRSERCTVVAAEVWISICSCLDQHLQLLAAWQYHLLVSLDCEGGSAWISIQLAKREERSGCEGFSIDLMAMPRDG